MELKGYMNFFFFLNIYIFCGDKRSKDPGPFHIKPKAHVKEKEMLEDEQRESRLLGYIAKDDPILGRPKSQKGKVPRC